jgi:hypothetical protein
MTHIKMPKFGGLFVEHSAHTHILNVEELSAHTHILKVEELSAHTHILNVQDFYPVFDD